MPVVECRFVTKATLLLPAPEAVRFHAPVSRSQIPSTLFLG
jgi:hypothetical protein